MIEARKNLPGYARVRYKSDSLEKFSGNESLFNTYNFVKIFLMCCWEQHLSVRCFFLGWFYCKLDRKTSLFFFFLFFKFSFEFLVLAFVLLPCLRMMKVSKLRKNPKFNGRLSFYFGHFKHRNSRLIETCIFLSTPRD